MRNFGIASLLATILLTTACGSSSSSGSEPTGSTGTSTQTAGTTTSGNTSTDAGQSDGGTLPGANVSLLDSGLSHSGTPIKLVPEVTNDPQVLSSGQNRVAALPTSPAIIFEVVRNQGTAAGLDCSALGAQYNSCSIVNLHIKDSDGSLDDKAWRLYFHSTRRILQAASNEFNVSHLNGDLHYVSPNDQFTGFGGGVKSIKIITEYNHLVETDFQPRYWIARGGNTSVITNTDNDTDESAYAMDITGDNRFEFVGENNAIATSSTRFDRNAEELSASFQMTPELIASRIVPRPNFVTPTPGSLDIGSGFSFAELDLPAASIAALQTRQAQFMSTNAGVPLEASIVAPAEEDSYELRITPTGIKLTATSEAMLFYGAQSLLALVEPGSGSIPLVVVLDSPRFDYRGMHVDVARNFHSVESMKKLIDQMGAYKLNKLHLHLSDDEGWRLEIPGLPELTSVGGKREFNVDENGLPTETNALLPAMGSGPQSNNQGSGFYTRAQFIDLLQYANARYVEVIPEFDMPAHARAAVVAMRARARNLGDANSVSVRLDDPLDTSRYLTVQNYNDSFINPCVEGTYSFLDTLFDEVKGMYTAANLPLDTWHMGGDEAINILLGPGISNPDTSKHDQPWAKSPACDKYINDTLGIDSREELPDVFVLRVSQIAAGHGITTLYAYQDILSDLPLANVLTPEAGVSHWVTLANANPATASNAIASANTFSGRGFKTVIGAPDFLYFDFPYEVDPKERGYYWATRELSSEKLFKFTPENLAQNAATSLDRYGNPWTATNQGEYQLFEGMQGFLWSETVRTPEQFDYMIFPRLLALAERAWHLPSWEQRPVSGETFSADSAQVDFQGIDFDYATFAAALATKELAKLDAAGVAYRIPPPGAKVIGGQLQMNSAFPGLVLEYSIDGSSWQVWNSANPPASATLIRSKSADGKRVSRITEVSN